MAMWNVTAITKSNLQIPIKIELFLHISPNNFIAGNLAITLRALVHKYIDSRHLLQHDYCGGKILEVKLNI